MSVQKFSPSNGNIFIIYWILYFCLNKKDNYSNWLHKPRNSSIVDGGMVSSIQWGNVEASIQEQSMPVIHHFSREELDCSLKNTCQKYPEMGERPQVQNKLNSLVSWKWFMMIKYGKNKSNTLMLNNLKCQQPFPLLN